jgi:hypothetical protein
MADFYKTLLTLKTNNKALNSHVPEAYAYFGANGVDLMLYVRRNQGDEVLVILNLTNRDQSAQIATDFKGYKDVFSGGEVNYTKGDTISLAPWQYIVAVKNP